LSRALARVALCGLLVVLVAACTTGTGSETTAATFPSVGPEDAQATGSTVPPEPTAPPALTIKKVRLTSSVSRNTTASVTVKTAARAQCSITVTYNSGFSTAAGLVTKAADSEGQVSWSWKVGGRTAFGIYPIDIYCSKGSASGSLELTFRVT